MPRKTDTLEEPQLNLMPMIDVVFLLISFFMVGACHQVQIKKFSQAFQPLETGSSGSP